VVVQTAQDREDVQTQEHNMLGLVGHLPPGSEYSLAVDSDCNLRSGACLSSTSATCQLCLVLGALHLLAFKGDLDSWRGLIGPMWVQ
jgi:hypothetical protein